MPKIAYQPTEVRLELSNDTFEDKTTKCRGVIPPQWGCMFLQTMTRRQKGINVEILSWCTAEFSELIVKNCIVIIKSKLYFIVEANLIKWRLSGYLSQMRARDAKERLEDIWITKLWRMFVRWASKWLVFARRRTTAVYGANSTQTTAGMCGQRDETLLWKQSGMCRTRKFKLCVFIGRW